MGPPPSTFTELFQNGPFNDLNSFYAYSQAHFRRVFTISRPSPHISQSHIVFHQVIGKGAFGMVIAGTRASDKFAIKVFDKKHLYKTKQIQRTIYEKQILASLLHPNVVEFYGAYKDNAYLYLAMGMVSGGELYEHLKIKNQFSEEESCLISAQIVLAFDYLHRINVVHRDIKAENVLLDEDGYVKITDMGFAKFLKGRAFTICGTPDYMAPEIMNRRGYYNSVDWWALGVLIYELNTGHTPFSAADSNKIVVKAATGKFKVPEIFSPELRDIVCGLLRVDPDKRYGSGKFGLDAIKGHSFFKRIDWWKLFQRRIHMAYRPVVGEGLDLSNFDSAPLRLREIDSDPLKVYFKDF